MAKKVAALVQIVNKRCDESHPSFGHHSLSSATMLKFCVIGAVTLISCADAFLAPTSFGLARASLPVRAVNRRPMGLRVSAVAAAPKE
eukprot:3623193-Rhodomonas_salina.3